MSEGDLIVLCIGDCQLDVIFECERYPHENVRYLVPRARWQRGGRASTICTVLRQLGVTCEFLGMISNAPSFQYLYDDFGHNNISIANCPQATILPPFTTVLLGRRKGTATITRSPDNLPTFTHQHFLGAVDYRRYRWIHFQAKNPSETIRMMWDTHAFTRRSGQRIIVSVDLERDQPEYTALAELGDYVFVHRSYLSEMCWQNLREACLSIRDILKPKRELQGRKQNIICANGLKGTACLDSNGRFTEFQPYRPKHIVDKLGANDVFASAVIYVLTQGNTNKLHEAVEYAVYLEGVKLGIHGYEGINTTTFRRSSSFMAN